MALNKFEKHIKEKLNSREIKPSDKAWQKLSGELEASKQPKKKGYLWYGIAASFVGFLMLSILYVNSEDTHITSDIQVVDRPEEKNIEANTSTTELLKGTTTEIKIAETTTNIIQHKIVQEPIAVTKQEVVVTAVEDKIISSEKLVKVEEMQPKLTLSDEIINTKMLEVIAQVNLLEENTNTLTDAEVDSLLLNVQAEILRDNIFNENRSVDAMALLTEVEDELDRSFKDKILQSLKAKFLKARTSVADSNN